MARARAYRQAFVHLKNSAGHWTVDPQLRPRLVADAAEAKTSLTDIACRILAERYKVPYTPSVRRRDPDPNDEVLNFAVPHNLANAIRRSADRNGRSSWIDEIRAALCAHYGFRLPIPPPHTRQRAVA